MIRDYVYEFSSKNEPVKRVKKGEIVTFKTLDCFSNQITTEEQLITGIDFNRVNPATGPVYVEDAKAGDVLVVDILKIDVEQAGIASTLPETGPLIHRTGELRTKVLPIKDGNIVFNDIEFPINPMIGVIGVAPKEGEVPCGFPGAHGGNMDCNKIVANSRVYFPVSVPGALFQLGDLHASMGDGEISGTGVEIGGEVKVKLDVIEDFQLEWPVLETEDMWYVIASDDNIELALRYACEQMQSLINRAYGWDMTDAYIYMSIRGSFEICQACKPSGFPAVVRFGVPKIEEKPGLISSKA